MRAFPQGVRMSGEQRPHEAHPRSTEIEPWLTESGHSINGAYLADEAGHVRALLERLSR